MCINKRRFNKGDTRTLFTARNSKKKRVVQRQLCMHGKDDQRNGGQYDYFEKGEIYPLYTCIITVKKKKGVCA